MLSAITKHFPNKPQHLDEDVFLAIFERAQMYVGSIIAVEEVRSGNVSFVYKVVGQHGSLFVKIRGTRFVRMPQIVADPTHIRYEKKALDVFGSHVLCLFPQVIEFNQTYSYLMLTDVFHGRPNFEHKLSSGETHIDDIALLGETVGMVHHAMRHITEGIREDNDVDFKSKTLLYCLEVSDHPILNELSREYRNMADRNLVLGDASPKNMSIGGGKIGICDLENAHLGHHVYDLAYIMAHVILHNLDCIDKARQFADVAYTAYIRHHPIVVDSRLLVQTILGVMMYRLGGKVVPYRLHMSKNQRESFYRKCGDILFQTCEHLDDALAQLSHTVLD